MKCYECRYHHALDAVHEHSNWKNCMALPYPDCIAILTADNAECFVPELARAIYEEPTNGN